MIPRAPSVRSRRGSATFHIFRLAFSSVHLRKIAIYPLDERIPAVARFEFLVSSRLDITTLCGFGTLLARRRTRQANLYTIPGIVLSTVALQVRPINNTVLHVGMWRALSFFFCPSAGGLLFSFFLTVVDLCALVELSRNGLWEKQKKWVPGTRYYLLGASQRAADASGRPKKGVRIFLASSKLERNIVLLRGVTVNTTTLSGTISTVLILIYT